MIISLVLFIFALVALKLAIIEKKKSFRYFCIFNSFCFFLLSLVLINCKLYTIFPTIQIVTVVTFFLFILSLIAYSLFGLIQYSKHKAY